MLRLIIVVLTVFVCTACNNSQDKPSSAQNGCVFQNPDTSLLKVVLGDAESAGSIITDQDSMDENDQYHFYSTMYRETLTMTQHPGSGKNQISIFKVEYSEKADHGYRKLSIDTFTTEKGIKLGVNKRQLIEKLGNCYVAKDSTAGYIELYYRLESPNDSKTMILQRSNMPIYYASYKLWNDRLEKFEFGFEYP